jgi:ORF6N domain
MSNELVPMERIENRIYLIRGQKVMLDRDLAELYEMETRLLKRAVRRNLRRFPDDFMFILSPAEIETLVSQIGIPSKSYFGGSEPFAFTEHGILMLSSVLNSIKAVDMNILIMRAFVRLRQIISGNKELAHKIDLLEKRVLKHDENIREIVRDIRKMTIEKSEKKLNIGFGK